MAAETIILGAQNKVQVFLTFELTVPVFFGLYLVIALGTRWIVNSLIARFQWSRKHVEMWILRLNFYGSFALIFALSANAGIHFGVLPSVISIFNPLLALYPIYIAYLLQMAVYQGSIRS